jgi:hypothetical protein
MSALTTVNVAAALSVKSELAALPVKDLSLNIPAQAYAKMPRKGSVRRRFVDALVKGATAQKLTNLIPETNKAGYREFLRYVASFGFGVKQEGNKFFLVMPAELDYA